jgi:eukaryotic-like serine/threonine-protein kinase
MEPPSPQHWRQIEELLDAALDLPPDARPAFLDELGGVDGVVGAEVLRLLAALDRVESFLPPSVAGLAASLLAAGDEDEGDGARGVYVLPERIGPYRVLREVGQGGMGTVFLAERDDPQLRQRVALKLVRSGAAHPSLVRRFFEERQILASLEHPNIARLLDGGITEEGLPWFAMEYVEGTPLDRYCADRRLGIAARLELFLRVCDAVQYAHRKLVVHRDLKPSNILVTGPAPGEAGGRVKLLDFGIAKLLSDEAAAQSGELTRAGLRPMTPGYASPEQIRGEAVSTASDVHALGVLLYTLLAGQHPYLRSGRPPHEVARAILEEEPALPSTLAAEGVRRRLRGDLDTIVRMAMRKEPERRYATVEQLAADIHRHLSGLPVSARLDTWRYRTGKFVHRHRAGVAAAVAFAALLGGYGVTITVHAERIAQERDRAETEALRARRVTDFLVTTFEHSDPRQRQGGDPGARTVREVLDAATGRIEIDLAAEPVVQAELRAAVGLIYMNLGEYERADSLLTHALLQRHRLHGARHLEVAESEHLLARLRWRKGDHQRADSLLRSALAIRRARLGPEDPEVARTLNELASVHYSRQDFAQAEPLFRAALAMRRKLLGNEHRDVAESLNDLGMLLARRGDFAAAEPLLRESLDLTRKVLGDDHPDLAISLGNFGWLLGRQGDYAAAEPLLRDALALSRRVWGEEHPNVAIGMNTLATMLLGRGDREEAKVLLRRTVELNQRLLGEEHPEVAVNLFNLARLLHEEGDLDAAEPLYNRVIAIDRRVYGDGHPEVSIGQVRLAQLLRDRGHTARAESLYRTAVADLRRALPPGDPRIATAAVGLGALLTARGSLREAEPLLHEGVQILQQAFGNEHWQVAQAQSLLGACLTAQARFAEAEPLLQPSYRVLVERRGATDRHTQTALQHLVSLYEAWGRPHRAAEYRALLTPAPAARQR